VLSGHRTSWFVLWVLAWVAGCSPAPQDGFDIEVSVSETIGTVVEVSWTAVQGDTAVVDVGEDETYGRRFSAERDGDRFVATLVGLRPSSRYHYRVIEDVVGDDELSSEDRTFATGAPPLSLAWTDVQGSAPDGYAVTSLVHVPSVVAILDADGEYVWWYEVGFDSLPGGNEMVTRNALSRDGESMFFLAWTPQYPGLDCTTDRDLVRVSLDGSQLDTTLVSGAHHDFVELADGTLALLAYDPIQWEGVEVVGDRVVEVAPGGDEIDVWSLWDITSPDPGGDYGDGTDYSHANAIRYDEADDAYLVSLRLLNTIVKIDRHSGEVLWRLGGADSDFQLPGGGTDLFRNQHHFQILDDGILVFDNGEEGAGETRVIQYQLDESTWTATPVWTHSPDPPRAVYSLGDVTRFDSGQTLVTWATAGEMELLDANGEREWLLNLGIGTGFGYTTWVEKLPGEI
jgi:hypothetical protein